MDLALLASSASSDVRSLQWAGTVAPGTTVLAVGYPAPFDASTPTVTRGIVSANRTVAGTAYLQLDASVNPGDSGGAVVTQDGLLAGAIVARVRGAQNLNLAVAASAAAQFLNHPTTRGLHPTARALSDVYLELNDELHDAALSPSKALQQLGQFPQTGVLPDAALNISARLAELRSRIDALPTSGQLGAARAHYLTSVRLITVDASTFTRIWSGAVRGDSGELRAIIERSRGEWLVGDDAAILH